MNLLLRCTDREATRAYYRDVLGFQVADGPEGSISATLEGGTLVFTEADLWDGPPRCTGTVYFFVPDLDAVFSRVQGRAELLWPPQVMSYGTREFAVRDCDGYVIAFAQRRD